MLGRSFLFPQQRLLLLRIDRRTLDWHHDLHIDLQHHMDPLTRTTLNLRELC